MVCRVKGRTQIDGVFEKAIRIFGCKLNEVTGGCRTFQKEESHNFFTSPNIWG